MEARMYGAACGSNGHGPGGGTEGCGLLAWVTEGATDGQGIEIFGNGTIQSHLATRAKPRQPASGKVLGLFLYLFGLFKDKKGKKGKKGQRHSVLLKPSRFTIQVAFYFERQ
jgi:hypothetical protein